MTIKEGSSLYVGTYLRIESNSSTTAYFADQTLAGDVEITGDITVQRYLTPDLWHNVASPVSNAHSNVFTGTNLVFYYDETIILNDWEFGWVLHSGALEVPRGYDVIFYDSPVTIEYEATGAETLNTGSYTIPVTITNSTPPEIPTRKGWNLVGNPYP
jgi:hypothetical protein